VKFGSFATFYPLPQKNTALLALFTLCRNISAKKYAFLRFSAYVWMVLPRIGHFFAASVSVHQPLQDLKYWFPQSPFVERQ
jgi:hypothetical protein